MRNIQYRKIKVGISVAIIGVILSVTPMGLDLEERYGLDILFKLRGAKTPPPEVVVVAITKKTLGYLKHGDRQKHQLHGEETYEWSRRYHARLLDKLSEKGASIVIFDMYFNKPRGNLEDDLDFAKSIEASGNVILGEWLDPKTEQSLPGKSANQPNMLVSQRILPPIPLFADVALGVAPFPLPKSKGQVRHFWTYKRDVIEKATLPLMALQVFSMDAYEQYLLLLKKIEPELAAVFPQDRALMRASKQIQNFMDMLRKRAEQDPSFIDRLLHELNHGIGQGFDSSARRMIHSSIHAYDGNSRYFNFYGGPGTISTIPYQRFLEEEKPTQTPIDVKGKVIFVGLMESLGTETDTIETIFSSEESGHFFGVEAAATAFGNLIAEDFIRPLQPKPFFVLIVLWGIVMGLICQQLRPFSALGAAVTLFISYSFFAYFAFHQWNMWFPLTVPFFQTIIAYAIVLTQRDVDTHPKLTHLKEAILKLLPHTKAHEVIEGREQVSPGGKTVFATLLNADMKGFTAMSEHLSPEALHEKINEYFAEIHTTVARNGGIVTDVAGDSMFAIWEHAQYDVSVQQKAFLAALAIREMSRKNPRGPAMQTRIGLHCGEISLGFVGSAVRCDFRQVSGTGNLTERIQQFNKALGTQTLCSEAVVKKNDAILTRKIGRVQLQGAKNTMTLYEVVGLRDQKNQILQEQMSAFAEALEKFEAKKWRDAWQVLSSLCLKHPEDGPAEYYLKLIEAYLDHPPPPTIDHTVLIQHLGHVKENEPCH